MAHGALARVSLQCYILLKSKPIKQVYPLFHGNNSLVCRTLHSNTCYTKYIGACTKVCYRLPPILTNGGIFTKRPFPLQSNFLLDFTAVSSYVHTSSINQKRAGFEELYFDNDLLLRYLESLTEEHRNISNNITSGEETDDKGNFGRRFNEITPIISLYNEYKEYAKELDELKLLITEDDDPVARELSNLAKQEVHQLEIEIQNKEEQIISLLTPEERGDQNDIILELAAGVGGTEAMIFTKQMLDMYSHYAAYNGWDFAVIAYDESSLDGLRKASASISGHNVYKYMKYEGGVHRVQRVPKTEKSGRVHTSTMSVAILPQPTEIEVQINPSDLRFDFFRASGAGGQHVNTTNSAVRIVHIPSGTTVECQSARSQIRNKELAMQILRSRFYEKQLHDQLQSQKTKRKLQVGSSGRSEKIRTYNFTQDRITDHRLSLNAHSIDNFLSGGQQLNDMIEHLLTMANSERLTCLLEEFNSQQNT